MNPSLAGAYHPISGYGAIGDGKTLALVGRNGSIDWLCWPRFDSPSIFGALLDSQLGGRFQVCPDGPYRSRQRYLENTNVLVTTFTTATGTAELTDFMTCTWDGFEGADGAVGLFRVVRGISGQVPFCIWYEPRPDYGRQQPRLWGADAGITLDLPTGDPLHLTSDRPWVIQGQRAEIRLTLGENETAAFTLGQRQPGPLEDWRSKLQQTEDYWKGWAGRCSYQGPWPEQVLRSALALKMLIYAPTGAVVAAPTTSLPEVIGGVRNWDYRFAWPRDAGMTLNALFSLGYSREAEKYADWLVNTLQGCRCGVGLKVLYALDGNCPEDDEGELGHLEGYRGSRPVRVGNSAHGQDQLDVYGEVLDCLAICHLFGRTREKEAWSAISRLVDHVARHWREPDSGIWEVRGQPRNFVYSKVMAWLALDRGIRAAEEFHLPADIERWRSERDGVRAEVLDRGVAGKNPAFVRAYEEATPDAANLLVAGAGLLPPDHPILKNTVDRVYKSLGRDALVYRYLTEDGLSGKEGAFLPCSFWLVEALARTGRVEEAAELFEEVLSYGNGLGLLPEEMDPGTKEYLGNYPQALSHIALINAAQSIERAQAPRSNRRDAVPL